MERCETPSRLRTLWCRSRSHAVPPPPAGRPRPPRLRGLTSTHFTVKLQGREVFVFDGAKVGPAQHCMGDPGQLDARDREGLQQWQSLKWRPAVGRPTAPGAAGVGGSAMRSSSLGS